MFVTKIYGMWTTSTNRHFLGVKITPGLLPHIAYFYRESNDTFSVEVWSYPSPDDLFDCPVMSWDEYAWVLGCSVDELSPEPTTPEENSKCIDPKLLQSEEPEPEACPAQSDSNVDKAAKDVIGESYLLQKEIHANTIVATDPNDTQEGAPRREKGKERETSLLSRKREHSTPSDNAAGPSKRPRRRSVSPEPEGPIASLSTGPSRHTIRRRRKDVGYKRGDIDCRVCGMECVTKQVLERHSLTHADDPIVFVCAGKQGESSASNLLVD